MNKKNRIILLILLLLALVAGFFIWREKKMPHTPADQAFKLEDSLKVEKLVITNTGGVTVKLEKDGKRWKLNDTATAMPVKVSYLLKTLSQIKMEYPIDPSDAERIKGRVMKDFMKIEIYHDKNGKPDKAYYVGEMLISTLGNYALMEIDGKPTAAPYIIEIPGFKGDIQVRFFTGVAEWRDQKIFDTGMDDIKKVTILYPYHPYSSFRLTVVDKDSAIVEKAVSPGDTIPAADQKLENDWNKKKKTLIKAKVNDFLNSFKYINAESFNDEYYGKDTVLNRKPLAKVYLENKSGVVDSMTIFLMPANQRTKTELPNGEEAPYDLDRYYALINHNKDFVIIQQFVFGKVLRQYNDFFIFE